MVQHWDRFRSNRRLSVHGDRNRSRRMIAEHGRIRCGVRYRLEGQTALIEIYAERLGCPEQRVCQPRPCLKKGEPICYCVINL
jgi:hypothetical protein